MALEVSDSFETRTVSEEEFEKDNADDAIMEPIRALQVGEQCEVGGGAAPLLVVKKASRAGYLKWGEREFQVGEHVLYDTFTEGVNIPGTLVELKAGDLEAFESGYYVRSVGPRGRQITGSGVAGYCAWDLLDDVRPVPLETWKKLALESAREMFWAELAQFYPEVTKPGSPAWHTSPFEQATESVLDIWLHHNHPTRGR